MDADTLGRPPVVPILLITGLVMNRTGIVGAKLLFSNDKMQHAGLVIGFGGLAGHWYLTNRRSSADR